MELHDVPPDFREFLRLLNARGVEYLLVGGFAVVLHGYPRATADMGVWVGMDRENARRVLEALREFGFPADQLRPGTLEQRDQIVRMGVPPVRIELLTTIDGVTFSSCYLRCQPADLGGVPVPLISLDDLKRNKRASGRSKDLNDLEHL